MLLTKFQPDLEQEGIVKFDGYVIEGASALWCAAGAGNVHKMSLFFLVYKNRFSCFLIKGYDSSGTYGYTFYYKHGFLVQVYRAFQQKLK